MLIIMIELNVNDKLLLQSQSNELLINQSWLYSYLSRAWVVVCDSGLSVDLANNRLWWIEQVDNRSEIIFCRLGDFTLNTSSFCLPTVFPLNGSYSEKIITALAVDEETVYFAQGAEEVCDCI